MKQTKDVENYGKVRFIFNQTLEEALDVIKRVEEDEDHSDVVYEPDVKSDKEDRRKELEEFKEYVRSIYIDCSILATEKAIGEKYNKKKNGKFRRGTTAHYKMAENCGLYDTEFTNSWNTLLIVGKAINEKEIEIRITTKWFTF